MPGHAQTWPGVRRSTVARTGSSGRKTESTSWRRVTLVNPQSRPVLQLQCSGHLQRQPLGHGGTPEAPIPAVPCWSSGRCRWLRSMRSTLTVCARGVPGRAMTCTTSYHVKNMAPMTSAGHFGNVLPPLPSRASGCAEVAFFGGGGGAHRPVAFQGWELAQPTATSWRVISPRLQELPE